MEFPSYKMQMVCYVLAVSFLSCTTKSYDAPFDRIFEDADSNLQHVLDAKDQFEIQIMFSPVAKIGDSIIVQDHFFNFRPDDFFYPSSAVDLPLAMIAVQKLNQIAASGIQINKDTNISYKAGDNSKVVSDTTFQSKGSSIGRAVGNLFGVNDRNASEVLYNFCDQDYLNNQLRLKGIFTNSRIVQSVGDAYSFEENKHTSAISFFTDEGDTIFTKPKEVARAMWLTPISGTSKGKGYISEDGTLVREPFDFSRHNFINIKDLQESLKRAVYPELYPSAIRYDIDSVGREYMLGSMYKRYSEYPSLGAEGDRDNDSHSKFFIYGDSQIEESKHIKIINKTGMEYGYLTDCAYIEDTKHDIAYFLTATILVNKNGIYKDDNYEYQSIGIPFLAELGRRVHQFMVDSHGKAKS